MSGSMVPARVAVRVGARAAALARRRRPTQLSRTAWRSCPCCSAVASAAGARSLSTTAAPSASTPSPHSPPPREVAVLGGGLTGLATAHYLARLLPSASHITLYEGSERLGGWIDSKHVAAGGEGDRSRADNDGDVVLEAGARVVVPQSRTPRYDDLLLLELVQELGLLEQLRVSDIRLPRYVYYPDHLVNVSATDESSVDRQLRHGDAPGLLEKIVGYVRLGIRVLTEPVFRGALTSFSAAWRSNASDDAQRQADAVAARPGGLPPDESVGAFAVRRTGHPELVDNLLSAVMHGVYGGDAWKLSVASSPLRGSWLHEFLERQVRETRRQVYQAKLASERKAAWQRAHGEEQQDEGEAATLRRAQGTVDGVKGPIVPAQTSDLRLVVDITLRMNHDKDAAQGQPFLCLIEASRRWTQFGFAGGFATLTEALAADLQARPNVAVQMGTSVTAVRLDRKRDKIEVTTTSPATGAATRKAYDRVVSTLSAPALYRLLNNNGGSSGSGNSDGGSSSGGKEMLPALRDEHAVTIQLVNLHYAEPGLNRPYNGFGYLLPQSVPLAANPEGALGVLFDTDRERVLRPLHAYEYAELPADGDADKSVSAPAPADTTTGTTFTVMLGGHYWDGYRYPDDFPSADEAVAMAEAVVRRHLGTIPEGVRPTATRTKLCRECIPQHYVGHADRMARAHHELLRQFGGRLAVAGGSFTAVGPGVLPSVRAAYDVALHVAGRGYRTARAQREGRGEGEETTMDHVGDTGLRRFAEPATDRVLPYPRGDLPFRYGNRT